MRTVWEESHMESFQDFLKWYNNKDVVPTLEALQKVMHFYHQKGGGMSKLGLTLPNFAHCVLHSSTPHKFYPFNREDESLDHYIRGWLTRGPSFVFTRYAELGKTKIQKQLQHV